MALTKTEIKSAYPLPAYNYRVTILEETSSSVISFSEVSGLAMEYEPIIYKHGFSSIMGYTPNASAALGPMIIPGMPEPIRITLRRGIVKSKRFLYDWIDSTYNDPFYEKNKRDILIDLCDEAGMAVVRWKLQEALPLKLEAPDFRADANEVAIESMELVAQSLRVQYDP